MENEKHTVLVTGGCGFIGSNFVRHLLHNRPGWQVINLDALTYAGNPANLADLENDDRYTFIHGDICDADLLADIFASHCIDAVVHLAAESHVDRSIHGPMDFVRTNVEGTCRLLSAALKNWRQRGEPDTFRFLHVSTDEVFGSLGAEGFFTESTAYDPSSPYSASKAAADHFVRAWHRTYGLPAMITNCSNNYGPYQFPEKLIPLMILNAAEGKQLPVYGDGSNVRDWLYVEDHCRALLLVLENGTPGQTYAVGGGAEQANLEVVRQICCLVDEKLGRGPENTSQDLIRFVEDRPGHDLRYAIDSSHIRNELGWRPQHDFYSALSKTVDWYLNNPEWVESVRSGAYRNWIATNYGQRLGRLSEASGRQA